LPFRPLRSARSYKKIWTNDGSPLIKLIDQLIQQANAAGGKDNITACVAVLKGLEQTAKLETVDNVTVDWGEQAALENVFQIINEHFSDTDTVFSTSSDPQTDPVVPLIKKKSTRFISYLLIFLAFVVIVIILRYVLEVV